MAGKYASKEIDAATLGGLGPTYYATAVDSLAKTVIPFTATATPTIATYQALYATKYGEHPVVSLVTIDGDGNYIQRSEQAKYVIAVGLIDSISWDLADAESGFIIIRA